MTKQNEFELSRRRVLGALGTIGVASAGAGLGTSAYFSDQETFVNNRLVAGSLDLKVDWEEHYSDWSDDEMEDPNDGTLDIQMSDPGQGYTAFPPGAPMGQQSLWVADGDVSQFMDNTAVEAYPDTGVNGTADDGVQDDIPSDTTACEYLADVGNDDDGLDPSGARSDNADTRFDDQSAKPLVYLEDVKPGDFGEVTFSLHLCTNPGYIWMNAANVSEADNTLTEPEADDPDEVDGLASGELADAIQTAWWYDANCDNLVAGGDGGGGNMADICFVIDSSGSMGNDRTALENGINDAATQLDSMGLDVTYSVVDYLQGAGVGLQPTSSVAALQADLADGPDAFAPGSSSGSGGESLSNAINFAFDNVNFRPGAKKIFVGFTDEPDQSTPSEITEAINQINSTNSAFLGVAIPGQNVETVLVDQINQSRFVDIDTPQFSTILEELVGFAGGVVGGEPVFFQGSLADALDLLTSGNGVPLDGDPSTEARDCFTGEETHCIGFSWWLPLDHGNEVQTDSVQFDLGFYTEQCRHNDGSGMNNEQVDPEEVDA